MRVRIEGSQARITVKGRACGIVRPEYEYPIPLSDAAELLDMVGSDRQVIKNRTKIPFKGKIWEVDEFFGKNKGLVVAEIELKSVNEPFEKPDWVGEDISEDEIKDLEDGIQKLTDQYVAQIDKAVDAKSDQILTV